jgi:acyl-coenzyme A thioesterase 13
MSAGVMEFLRSQIGKGSGMSPSPLMRWLNPDILQAEEGTMILRYSVREEMSNPLGQLHGGIAAAIIDDAIGCTLYGYGHPAGYATINNYIDYLLPAKVGDNILAKTIVVKKGNRIVNAQCELLDENSQIRIARGVSNLIKN